MKNQFLSYVRSACIVSSILAINTSCKELHDSDAKPETKSDLTNIEQGSLSNLSDTKLNTDSTINSDYEVRGEVLYFRNARAFMALDSKLNKMHPEERLNFTRSINFISAADVISEANQKLEKANTKEEFNSIADNYQDIIKVYEGSIESTVNRSMAYIINRKGMVSIGGYIHIYTKEGQMILGKSVEEAEQYMKNPQSSNLKVTVFKVSGSIANARPTASCSSIDKTEQNGDGARRVRIQTSIGVEYFCLYGDCQNGNAQYQVQQYAYTIGTPTKKNIWGNFVTYRTGNTLSTRYSLDFSSVATGNITRNITADYVYSNDWDSIDYKQTVAAAQFYGSFQGPQYTTWTNTFYEGAPKGYYTSGGVPSGVPQACQ